MLPDARPKVSIVLPNRNSIRFLEERMRTILAQTLVDWELIVVDGCSDDGTWELLQRFAEADSRIHLSQSPPQGIYTGLNECLRQARGEYVYIAPSDDTMSPDCLAKMVMAMDAHPECDLCHTCLKIIDEQGQEIPNSWRQFPAARFYGELLNTRHIRLAPFDGLLHCALYMLYSSLTQLLIRRSVFAKVGVFRADWGSIGDFEWNMRAALVCNTLHLPDTLATWRVHARQATDSDYCHSAEYRAQLCRMIVAALPLLRTYAPELYRKIRVHRLLFPYRRAQMMLELGVCDGWLLKACYLLRFMFVSPGSVRDFVRRRFFGQFYQDDSTYIQAELKRLGFSLEQSVNVLT